MNGGFEETGAGWQSVPGTSLFTYATDHFVGGQHSLLLGYTGPDNIPVHYGVEQSLALPAESSGIEFSFHYAILVEGEASPGDQAYLTFFDIASNHLLAMLVLSPTGGTWSIGRYDLTPLAGKNVRMAFASQNDGDPGKLIMRVDDVSIRACLTAEALSLQPLPPPTPTPLPPEPLLLLPQPLPTPVVAVTPTASTQENPGVVQEPVIVPHRSRVTALAECNCSSSLYVCSDFSSWAVAQACFTQCQVTAGYDIHNLDHDKNGVACELELQDVAPLDATPSPQPTPSTTITETGSTQSNAPPVAADAMTGTATESVTASMTISGPSTLSVPSGEQPAGADMTTTVVTTGTASTGTVTTETVAAESGSPVETSRSFAPADGDFVDPPVELSALDIFRVLLSSPWGFVLIGAFLIMGAFVLWSAYRLSQQRVPQPPQTGAPRAPDDFTLQPNEEAPASKT